MLNKKFAFAVSCASILAACTTPADNRLGGGVSEETNNFAGLLLDGEGKPVAGASVYARHIASDTIAFCDTTGADGMFGFRLERRGYYALTSVSDSLAVYETVDFQGREIKMDLNLKRVASLKGMVNVGSEGKTGVTLSLPGSHWSAEMDAEGNFEIDGLPVGEHALLVSSPDSKRYDSSVYGVKLSENGDAEVFGPLPSSLIHDMDLVEWPAQGSASEGALVIDVPSASDYGLLSWWTFDYLRDKKGYKATIDARGATDTLFVYGIENLEDGNTGKALPLQSAEHFGVVENDHGILDDLTELTFEVVMMFDSADTQGSYRKNIVGKLGFGDEGDKDVFSFALINNVCGVEIPTVAFFLADGAGDSLRCENAIVAKDGIEYGTWLNYVVTWGSDGMSLYKNGALIENREVSVERLNPSKESIFFGKENINVKLDDVRLGAKAITSADVLYRYYLRGRSL